ncbi:DUF1178 family protein [Acuticoccus mangrovi]|uniref:DUF1178 family protein n=1 Tax=Acuticoccus mangrovi TaxID=2796142 RepID=A0A934IK17_9HYPH|nr:DUF1178 family protein [Acuticoccus mangrovi]MBJ3774080.1 DUF1178 family protein [Acuticoccus mangrovi]
MIHYSVKCAAGHAFDGWFASSAAFERQATEGLLSCPICGSTEVERALMAPSINTGGASVANDDAAPEATAPAAKSPPQQQEVALMDPRAEALREAVTAIRKAVMETSVDVGRAFPEEARKMHYGETERRGIYGQADLAEARALVDEGIDVLPLPTLPADSN